MQRINYFTNPNFTGPFADVNISGEVKASYNADTKQLNIYGNNGGYGFNLTVPKNAALVFACFLWTEHDKNPKPLTVYSLESSDTKPIAYATVSQNANNLLLRFNSTGSGRIRVEFYPNGSAANIANPILELADTYDKAVGGASGLLLRRHDATRIGASVGRVMSDDNHEPMPEPNLDHHLESQQLGASHDRSEREIYDILGQFRYERHRRHCLDYRNTGEFSARQRVSYMTYVDNSSPLSVNYSVKSGSPTVTVTNILLCTLAEYQANKTLLGGIGYFTGDTMPRA